MIFIKLFARAHIRASSFHIIFHIDDLNIYVYRSLKLSIDEYDATLERASSSHTLRGEAGAWRERGNYNCASAYVRIRDRVPLRSRRLTPIETRQRRVKGASRCESADGPGRVVGVAAAVR